MDITPKPKKRSRSKSKEKHNTQSKKGKVNRSESPPQRQAASDQKTLGYWQSKWKNLDKENIAHLKEFQNECDFPEFDARVAKKIQKVTQDNSKLQTKYQSLKTNIEAASKSNNFLIMRLGLNQLELLAEKFKQLNKLELAGDAQQFIQEMTSFLENNVEEEKMLAVKEDDVLDLEKFIEESWSQASTISITDKKQMIINSSLEMASKIDNFSIAKFNTLIDQYLPNEAIEEDEQLQQHQHQHQQQENQQGDIVISQIFKELTKLRLELLQTLEIKFAQFTLENQAMVINVLQNPDNNNFWIEPLRKSVQCLFRIQKYPKVKDIIEFAIRNFQLEKAHMNILKNNNKVKVQMKKVATNLRSKWNRRAIDLLLIEIKLPKNLIRPKKTGLKAKDDEDNAKINFEHGLAVSKYKKEIEKHLKNSQQTLMQVSQKIAAEITKNGFGGCRFQDQKVGLNDLAFIHCCLQTYMACESPKLTKMKAMMINTENEFKLICDHVPNIIPDDDRDGNEDDDSDDE